MRNKALLYVLLLSLFSSISLAAVDCSDPKNRPRDIAGILVGGGIKIVIVRIKEIANVTLMLLSVETQSLARSHQRLNY